MAWVTISYSVGVRPSSPSADQVRRRPLAASFLVSPTALPPFFVQVPDELVLTRAQPAAERRHLRLERRQVERAPQVPLDGSSSHAALPFGADADVVAAIDDPDVLPGVIVLDGGEHRVGQLAGPEHRTDVIIEPGHLPLLRDA